MSARQGGDTLPGRQAYSVLTWVYEDPVARASVGVARVSELARQAAGAALAEVQDVGKMLSRLLGTTEPEPEPAQLAGISGQFLHLASTAHNTASATAKATWARDELRGAHGQWSKGGSISSQAAAPRTSPMAGIASRVQANKPAETAATPEDPRDVVPAEMENVMKAHAAAEMAKTLRAEHAADIYRMVDKVAATNKELADTQNKEDTQSPNAPYARLVLSHSAHHCRASGR